MATCDHPHSTAWRNNAIYEAWKAGKQQKIIAAEYGRTPQWASNICRKIDSRLKIAATLESEKRANDIIKAIAKARRSNYLARRKGQVIDMGGQDGLWHEWTPETNADELGAECASPIEP